MLRFIKDYLDEFVNWNVAVACFSGIMAICMILVGLDVAIAKASMWPLLICVPGIAIISVIIGATFESW